MATHELAAQAQGRSAVKRAPFKIKLCHDHIALNRKSGTMTEFGLYIPDTAKALTGPQYAEVLGVGPGRMSDHCCEIIPMPDVKVGDTIKYHGGAGFADEHDGEEYWLILRGDVIGVV